MLFLYVIFVIIPFLIFSFFVYRNVSKIIHEKNRRNEFFSCLKYDNKQYDVYDNFSNKYEIEKYIYYLKVERGIEANYDTEILEGLNDETKNEKYKQNLQYIENILDDIYNDTKYIEDSEVDNPQNSWMRKLANEDIVKLKVLLLKKAICFLPICNKIFQDKNKKYRLYNNYYIDDNMSKQLDGQCDEFLEEFNRIIFEANCLTNKWDAYRIYNHNKAKAEEEKKKKEELKNTLKKQKLKEKKLKETTEKANLLANEIIEEENSKKKKKKNK
ncbi:conserved Plasmodium protein, unknown function [Plasmodium gallinaceum]|uniref:Uncharacterized protein n=1 Tax=Plasmodium gallinaceum TaxID=5849 RepID=A0A1J1GT76_PLAGA|nr:conserved Plasmodium protein, unknown function [Plasmodium gallinaceum]CRG95432.1 conserved Plasmodium protein, unknown function [Plasmodium gallinaceum]